LDTTVKQSINIIGYPP